MRPGTAARLEHLVVGRQPVATEQGGLFGQWGREHRYIGPAGLAGIEERAGPGRSGKPWRAGRTLRRRSRRDRGRGGVRPGRGGPARLAARPTGHMPCLYHAFRIQSSHKPFATGAGDRYNGTRSPATRLAGWTTGQFAADSRGMSNDESATRRQGRGDRWGWPGSCWVRAVDRRRAQQESAVLGGVQYLQEPGRPAGRGRVGDDRPGDAQGGGARRRPGSSPRASPRSGRGSRSSEYVPERTNGQGAYEAGATAMALASQDAVANRG